MAYGNFINNINRKFEGLCQDIEAGFNFEYGAEFEIALCGALRLVLPAKFGICRGFIVASDGTEVGDDIIIFDRERFPPLRLLENDHFAGKQRIPIEAVYAYIEAKHTLYVADDGGQSLVKASHQIAQIKALPRLHVPLNHMAPGVIMESTAQSVTRDVGWPNYRNPLFCAIVSRNVGWKPKESAASEQIISHLEASIQFLNRNSDSVPDMIIAGPDLVCLSAVDGQIKSPFYVEGTSSLTIGSVSNTGFGIAVCILSWALDSILLGNVDWPLLLSESLQVPVEDNQGQ